MQRFTISLFLQDALLISGGFSVHHQELKTTHTASLARLAAGSNQYWSDKYLTLYG